MTDAPIESYQDSRAGSLGSFTKKPAGALVTLGTDGPNGLRLVALARGGYLLTGTGVGPIQFGIPPETIKDSMKLQHTKVATNYVIYGPDSMFSRHLGLSKAEFEFPAYFNYFVLGKRINLITTPEIEARMLAVFQETLMGPEVFDIGHDLGEQVPPEEYFNLPAESQYLDKDRPKTTVDKLLKFTHFDPEGVAHITGDDGTQVEVTAMHRHDGGAEPAPFDAASGSYPVDYFAVYFDGIPVAHVPAHWEPAARRHSDQKTRDSKDGDTPNHLIERPVPHFEPPLFGVTMLGSSHGFDPNGNTTGFVVWMNGRGTMVDPPPESDAILEAIGVPPLLIDGMILTHCHADHDAGTFQQILRNKRVTVLTAKTVFDSFQRKYSAITGLSTDALASLCDFKHCRVGEMVPWHGGFLKFFFSLHVIPCVGFEAHYGGKSLTYSADTMTNPELVQRMLADGVVTSHRARELIAFPSAVHSLVLHDAGVPPIHTPLSILKAFPEELKQRIWLVHVADHTVPPDSGLKVAHEGDTIVVEGVVLPPEAGSLQVMDFVRSCETFAAVTSIDDAYDMLHVCERVAYPGGTRIVEAGTVPTDVMLVAAGTVREVVSKRPPGHSRSETTTRRHMAGDVLSSSWLLQDAPAATDFITDAPVVILRFPRAALLRSSVGPRLAADLSHIATMNVAGVEEAMRANKLLAKCTRSQQLQVKRLVSVLQLRAGDELWRLDEGGGRSAYLVASGVLRLQLPNGNVQELEFGDLAIHIQCALKTGSSVTSLSCLSATTSSMVFSFNPSSFARLLHLYPGLFVQLRVSGQVVKALPSCRVTTICP